MALLPNQISQIVQSQLGRPSTDFENTTYANSSIQDLANLKETYGSLNKDTSITDYLKYNGLDSSPEARAALGAKYGITGIGTDAGNIALLNALKSGQKPTTTPPAPVQGTVTTPKPGTDQAPTPGNTAPPGTPNADPNDPSKNNPANGTGTVKNQADQGTQTTDTTTAPSTIGNASSTSDSTTGITTVNEDPTVMSTKATVDTAMKDYQAAQSQVAQIDSQIASLRTSLTSVVQNIKDEAAQSGAFITESQAQEIAQERTTAINGQISDLMSQRSQYATAQSQAQTALTQARSDYQDAQSNYFKSANLSISEQKLQQAGYKQQKVNTYDAAGNVTGQQIIWTQNPADTTGYDANGNTVTITQGSSGAGVVSTSSNSSSNSVINGIDFSSYATDPNKVKNTNAALVEIKTAGATASAGAMSTYITTNFPNSPVTGQMIFDAAAKYGVDAGTLAANIQEESQFGTQGKATSTLNPGNVGNDDSGKTKSFTSWSDGVNATAQWMQQHSVANLNSGSGGPNVSSGDQELPPASVANGNTPDQILNYLTSGAPVPIKGSSPIPQETLYSMAIQNMMGTASTTGGRIPAGASTAIQTKIAQIQDAYGLTPADIQIAKTQFQALTSANQALIQTSAYNNMAASIALDNLSLAIKASQSLPRGGAKIENKYSQWVAGNFTPAGNLASLETYVYTFAREYAKVTSGASQSTAGLTDSASAEAENLLNAAQSPTTFATVAAAMQADMQNVINENNKSTSGFPDAVKQLYGGILGNPSSSASTQSQNIPKDSMSDSQFVEKALSSNNIKYDDFKSNVPSGEKAVIDNATGQAGYIPESEFDPSKYTSA